MKKSIKIAAAVLAAGAVTVLAGCGGCSSCNNNKNLAVTNSNWYTGTSYKGIQPSFVPDETHAEYTKEIIEYTVTHDKSSAGNGVYSADYDEGTFTTEFYAFEYDWNGNRFYSANEKEILYVFKTDLDIPSLKYTLKATNEQTETYHDSVKSVVYFRAAGKRLQPVYSKQEIDSHSPASLQPSSLKYVCDHVNKTYENFYSFDCTEVTTVDGESESVYKELGNIKFSVFDNSSLYIAARSLKLSESLSQTVYLYNAISGGASEYALTGASTALDSTEGKTEIKAISAEMQRAGLFVPSENRETIPAVALNIGYAGGDLHGTTQTIWYAAIEDADRNVGRTTMLKLSIPLPYSLGTLNYSLKEIKSTLWNG